jgi:hypothetical protein
VPNSIDVDSAGRTVGIAGLGLRGQAPGTVAQQVHDGDTMSLRAIGNLGTRFLGVDAPEVSFTLPGSDLFRPIDSPEWDAFLSDPFGPAYPPFPSPLDPALQADLATRAGPGAAANHARHADAATQALRAEVRNDIVAMGATLESFQFYLRFAAEIVDRYGRLLCYANRNQPIATPTQPRPLSYNERMLQQGLVIPYFIWPNIDPFKRQGSLLDAVPPPGTADELADSGALGQARGWVAAARTSQTGIFEAADPLRILPFELRFLGRREPPDRWVIDLSVSTSVLLQPQHYLHVANLEDRLYVNADHVPLFVERGWTRES